MKAEPRFANFSPIKFQFVGIFKIGAAFEYAIDKAFEQYC